MSGNVLDQIKTNDVALTEARLEKVRLETRKDEAKLKKVLEEKRLKRRLCTEKGKTK